MRNTDRLRSKHYELMGMKRKSERIQKILQGKLNYVNRMQQEKWIKKRKQQHRIRITQNDEYKMKKWFKSIDQGSTKRNHKRPLNRLYRMK